MPIRRQLSELDCGAACLSSLLAYHGYENTTSEIADLLDAGRSGVTAASIKDVASGLGLSVRGFKLREPEDLRHLSKPCLLHWRFAHFVVLEKVSRHGLRLMDPNVGRTWVTLRHARRTFTGVALTVVPGAGFARRRQRARSLWRVYVRDALQLKENRRLFVQVVAVTLLIQIVGLLLPLLTKVIVDEVIPAYRPSMMAVLAGAFLLVASGAAVITTLRHYGLAMIRARLDATMTSSFVSHLLRLPFSFFAKRPTGDLIARVASNAEIREILTNRVIAAVLDAGFATTYLLVIVWVSWKFGLLVSVLGFLEVATLFATAPRLRELMRRNTADAAREQAYLVDVLQNILTLKSNGAENVANSRWRSLFEHHLLTSLRIGRFTALLEGCVAGLRQLAPLAALWLGAHLVVGSDISLGTMFLLIGLSTSFLLPLNSVVASGRQVYVAYALIERLADVMEAKPEPPPQSSVGSTQSSVGSNGKGKNTVWDIRLHRVSFRYSQFEPFVLSDISLYMADGATTAVVGPSGSGKSTLLGILTGIHRAVTGEVVIGDTSLSDLDQYDLRRQFGVVVQDELLFGGTLRKNLDLFQPGADLHDLEEACRIACLDDLLERLPMGFESLIGQGGGALSGGERQRVALARALVRRPRVLVLDEATSHLDTATETLIRRNLESIQCTKVVVAHRLSTVVNSDQIVVIKDGRIVETGTHRELASKSSTYATLCREQGVP